MIAFPLEVPARSGEVLLAPRGRDVIALARDNRAAAAASPATVAGLRLASWQAAARAEALALARRYTAALGFDEVPEGELILATGHQPVFPHPGIWVKFLLLDRLAQVGHTALAVSVDTDAMEEAAVGIPVAVSGGMERRRILLRRAGPEEPYETLPAPSAAEWEAFLDGIDRGLGTLPPSGVHAAWDRFRRTAPAPAGAYAAFLTALRRRWEGTRRLLEVPMSALSRTETFGAFVLHIAGGAARFAEIHNRHLRAYREAHHIRTEAQPFPDLEVSEERVELPFWAVRGGRRERLFLRRGEELATATGSLGGLPAEPREATALQIRPRAMTLTAFLRLALCDLFIHGVSGARYDRVTDAVVAEFLETAPPRYLAASATLHLPLGERADRGADRAVLARRVQEARHNPDRLLRDPTPEQRALIEEKWTLIRRLEEERSPRRVRREMTRRIRAINERLAGALSAPLAELEAALAALGEREGEEDGAAYRGYPFFLFDPEAMEPLVEALIAGQEPAEGGTP